MMVLGCLSIDFGTTNTVAVVTSSNSRQGGVPQRLKLGNDWRLPSAVFWAEQGPIVGVNAQRSHRLDPTRFVRCPKREMGHDLLPVGGDLVPVSEVVAAVLRAVRQEAAQQLGGVPARVVLTRPVQWARTRREMFEHAVDASGFTDAEFLEEPVAAAIRLSSLGQLPGRTPFGVVDFGGGTLDVAVVQREGAGFDVLASDGVDPLGGEDIDDLIFAYVVGTSRDREAARQLADSSDPTWHLRRDAVRDGCRLAKEQLSEQDRGAIGLPHTGEEVVLTRERFDGLAGPVLQRAAGTLHEAVRESGFDPSGVPVYLVGGSSRIPALAEIIRAQMNCPVVAIGDPQFVVSEGAALSAAHRPSPQRGQMPFERIRDRFPDQWVATEEATRRATELLRVARQKALEAGERARSTTERMTGRPGKEEPPVARGPRASGPGPAPGTEPEYKPNPRNDPVSNLSGKQGMIALVVVIVLLVIIVVAL
jgi:molecular chaperone DnaK (HSP70)